MEKYEYDPAAPWILKKMIATSERLLESHKTANMLIIVLVILFLIPLLGIGILVTLSAAPAPSSLEQ